MGAHLVILQLVLADVLFASFERIDNLELVVDEKSSLHILRQEILAGLIQSRLDVQRIKWRQAVFRCQCIRILNRCECNDCRIPDAE